MNFKITAHTDIGIKKSTNQDSVLMKIAQTDYGKVLLAAVCDGMGGLARGELASATLVRMLSRWFEQEFPALLYQGLSIDVLKKSWEDLVYRANERISKYGRAIRAEMGTTMVVLLIIDRVYYIINVGDSRIYILKDELTQITKDQTFIQREMDEGRMTYQEARRDPRRNVLLQCVGASPVIVPDYYSGTVDSGSMFLLCSDGFRHTISVDELYQYLNPYRLLNEQSMLENLQYLVELNKYRQETDNISAALVRVD
ncbi:MAG: serine/threonine-protein phosphatase [Lachnospiraceae bacterium]|nr:serine/threonine-protein phosphatase [Lachnospiraceae bacterium]